MSPMAAIAVTSRPPPPSPWSARKAINSVMLWDWPHSAEPIRNSTIATWSTIFRP